MRGNDDVVQVGLAEQRLEEGVGVADACPGNDGVICDEAVAPAHGHAQLPAALDQEQRRRAHLHQGKAE